MTDFVVGGVVPPNSPAYVQRPFEDEAFGHLTSAQGDWVLLLGPRQHGKTSGLLRLRERLEAAGYTVPWLDMQAYGGTGEYSTLLAWVARQVADAVGQERPEPPAGREEDVEAWLLAALAGCEGAVAVIIDEAAAVPAAYRQRFYGQLRALFNARRMRGPDHVLARLTFLFSGTFRPELLIDSDNSPFNVSKDVTPMDLSLDDARDLARTVGGGELVAYADRAFELVAGQPYLLQLLLDAVAKRTSDEDRTAAFDATITNLRLGRDRHLTSLFERVLADADTSTVVTELVAAGQAITFSAADPQHRWLVVLGVAQQSDGQLYFRNSLYREFAAGSPQLTPEDRPIEPTVQPLLHPDVSMFDCMEDEKLRELALDSTEAAVDAYNGGHPRLALSGFGSALEAILLSFLENLDHQDLAHARQGVPSDKRPSGPPRGWTLQQMSLVAHDTTALPRANQALSSAVRNWRNLIHPDKARAEWLTEDELRPEAQTAAAILQMVLRDLGKAT